MSNYRATLNLFRLPPYFLMITRESSKWSTVDQVRCTHSKRKQSKNKFFIFVFNSNLLLDCYQLRFYLCFLLSIMSNRKWGEEWIWFFIKLPPLTRHESISFHLCNMTAQVFDRRFHRILLRSRICFVLRVLHLIGILIAFKFGPTAGYLMAI